MTITSYVDLRTPLERSLDDAERAVELLRIVAGDLSDVHYTLMEWEPASKARPRFGKGGRTYTPAESRKAEARTAAWLRMVFPEPFTGNVAMACLFYRPNRQRIDVDNMLKHVCDAANDIVWADDSQVTSVTGIVELDPEHPRTLMAVAPHMTTMTRGSDATYPCVQCGRPILMTGQTNRRKSCSPECAARSRGFELLDVPVPCAECGEPFKRTTRAQRLCSPECRINRIRGAHKGRARPKSECQDCGLLLTHHRGGRCRGCWRRSVAVGPQSAVSVGVPRSPADTVPAPQSAVPPLEGEARGGTAQHPQEQGVLL